MYCTVSEDKWTQNNSLQFDDLIFYISDIYRVFLFFCFYSYYLDFFNYYFNEEIYIFNFYKESTYGFIVLIRCY